MHIFYIPGMNFERPSQRSNDHGSESLTDYGHYSCHVYNLDAHIQVVLFNKHKAKICKNYVHVYIYGYIHTYIYIYRYIYCICIPRYVFCFIETLICLNYDLDKMFSNEQSALAQTEILHNDRNSTVFM
jgi:hypothetical protein